MSTKRLTLLSPEREEIGRAGREEVRRMERAGWRIAFLSDDRVMVVGHRSTHIREVCFEGRGHET